MSAESWRLFVLGGMPKKTASGSRPFFSFPLSYLRVRERVCLGVHSLRHYKAAIERGREWGFTG